jgi:hypothetical protein
VQKSQHCLKYQKRYRSSKYRQLSQWPSVLEKLIVVRLFSKIWSVLWKPNFAYRVLKSMLLAQFMPPIFLQNPFKQYAPIYENAFQAFCSLQTSRSKCSIHFLSHVCVLHVVRNKVWWRVQVYKRMYMYNERLALGPVCHTDYALTSCCSLLQVLGAVELRVTCTRSKWAQEPLLHF